MNTEDLARIVINRAGPSACRREACCCCGCCCWGQTGEVIRLQARFSIEFQRVAGAHAYASGSGTAALEWLVQNESGAACLLFRAALVGPTAPVQSKAGMSLLLVGRREPASWK